MAPRNALSRRRLLASGGVAVAAAAIAPCAAWAAAAPAPSEPTARGVDPLSLIDPELRAPLETYRKEEGDYPINAANLARVRKLSVNPPLPAPHYDERSIPGAQGAPDVHLFVVNAAPGSRPRPAILHIHGGGFIAGGAVEYILKSQRIAQEHDCVVVIVDYRLAPEIRYPGSLQDNYAALKWLHASAGSLGVDPSRIAVMGASAGGGHAAMLAIAARDRGEVPIAFQLLIYPMLDDRTGSTRRVPPFIGKYVWVPESNRFGWRSLLGVPAGSRVVPAGAVPARVENLAGLPPTFIGVGAVDLFIDEDINYARRLIDSGVPTELCVVPGAYHGFDIIAPKASVSKTFWTTWSSALTRAFNLAPTA